MGFDYSRTADNALHSFGHLMETHLGNLQSVELFWYRFGGNNTTAFNLNGGCGNVHFPPNGRSDYEYGNTAWVQTSCEDWNPSRSGQKTQINCTRWGCNHRGYLLWWMQNMPNRGNVLTYQNKLLPNWWDFFVDLDTTLIRYNSSPSFYTNSSFFSANTVPRNGAPITVGTNGIGTFQLTRPLSRGTTYHWRVQSKSSNLASNWSTPYTFRTYNPPLAPQPLTPKHNTLLSTENIRFSWRPVTHSVYGIPRTVELQLSDSSTFQNVLHTEQFDSSRTTEIIPNFTFQKAMSYYWKIRSINSDGDASTWSTPLLLRTTSSVPQQLFPVENETVTVAQPRLEWTHAGPAVAYHVQLSPRADFAGARPIGVATNQTFYIPPRNLANNTTYYWRVRSVSRLYGNSDWSSTRKFTSATVTSSPVLVLPANGTAISSENPTLSWKQTTPEASYFHVQVASDATFTQILHQKDNISGNTLSYSPSEIPLNTNSMYWRVRAKSTQGHWSAWSTTGSFSFALPKKIYQTSRFFAAPTFAISHRYGGTNPLLVVSLSYRNGTSAPIQSAVTYGNLALTLVKRTQHQEYVAELWYLAPGQRPRNNYLRVATGVQSDSHHVTAQTLNYINQLNPLGEVREGGDASFDQNRGDSHSLQIPVTQGSITSIVHTIYSGENSLVVDPIESIVYNQSNGNTISTVHTQYHTGSTNFVTTWTSTKDWPWAAIAATFRPN